MTDPVASAPSGPPLVTKVAHPHAQVDWRLEAVLDRRLHDDLDVEVPLVVV